MQTVPEYGWKTPAAVGSSRLLLPGILRVAGRCGGVIAPGTRVLDLGCGNGYIAGSLLGRGCEVTGVDASASGIEIARQNYPGATWIHGSIDDGLCDTLAGRFDVVISTEVVEHLYSPRRWAELSMEALRPGGVLICSTPYHGYLKNLSLSLLGKWDKHANPAWEGGHIKLWSPRTLQKLLGRAGFERIGWVGVGRVAWLWRSMLMWGFKPGGGGAGGAVAYGSGPAASPS